MMIMLCRAAADISDFYEITCFQMRALRVSLVTVDCLLSWCVQTPANDRGSTYGCYTQEKLALGAS